jgi:hypothetical protein
VNPGNVAEKIMFLLEITGGIISPAFNIIGGIVQRISQSLDKVAGGCVSHGR